MSNVLPRLLKGANNFGIKSNWLNSDQILTSWQLLDLRGVKRAERRADKPAPNSWKRFSGKWKEWVTETHSTVSLSLSLPFVSLCLSTHLYCLPTSLSRSLNRKWDGRKQGNGQRSFLSEQHAAETYCDQTQEKNLTISRRVGDKGQENLILAHWPRPLHLQPSHQTDLSLIISFFCTLSKENRSPFHHI